jgi:hypothetical protein
MVHIRTKNTGTLLELFGDALNYWNADESSNVSISFEPHNSAVFIQEYNITFTEWHGTNTVWFSDVLLEILEGHGGSEFYLAPVELICRLPSFWLVLQECII